MVCLCGAAGVVYLVLVLLSSSKSSVLVLSGLKLLLLVVSIMIRLVLVVLLLLVLLVDVRICGGGDNKEKSDKKRTAEKSSACDGRKAKKLRSVEQLDDREVSVVVRDDDTMVRDRSTSGIPQLAGLDVYSPGRSHLQWAQSNVGFSTADINMEDEDDDEAQIGNFMRSLHNVRRGADNLLPGPSVSVLDLPDSASAPAWVPDLSAASSEPLRLRLRQLRSGDVTATASVGQDTTSTWSTQQDLSRQSLPSLPTRTSSFHPGGSDAQLDLLNSRVDALQATLEQFIATVTPMVEENVRDRNRRLGPDVRLRTNSPTVLADALRHIPTTNAHTGSDNSLPTQTSTSQQLEQIQGQIRRLQLQQQALQTQQFAQQTGQATSQRATLPRLGSVSNGGSVMAQLPLASSCSGSGFGAANPAPPLDKKIMDAIQRGEYINFNLILSATSFEVALMEDNEDEAPFSISMNRDERGRSVLDFKQTSASRSKVKNFQSWSIAFTWYMRAMAGFHPHLLVDLIQYQGIITRFATQYAASAWLNYDRAFRRRVAMHPRTPWNAVDEEIFSIFLRGAPPAFSLRHSSAPPSSAAQGSGGERCFRCRGFGHRVRQCPSGGLAAFTPPQSRASTSALSIVPPRRPVTALPRLPGSGSQSSSLRPGVCFAFNDGHCPRGERLCGFRHACGTCNLPGHTASTCSQSTADRG